MNGGHFGGLVRRHRERLGLSHARVAELVGRTTGTVKAWEKGKAVPNDPVALSSLAAVLGIEEHELFRAAGVEPPAGEQTLTIEQSLASIAPHSRERQDAPAPNSQAEWNTAVDLDPARSSPPRSEPVLPGPRPQPEEPAPDGWLEWARRLVRDRLASSPTPARTWSPPQPAPPATPSYLEDPEQRLTYRLRGIYTAVGIAAALIVLVWALGNTLEALGDAWDAIFSGI